MSILPVLDSRVDSLSCDYPAAHYECKFTNVPSKPAISAHHIISGADALSDLFTSGKAQFAVEVVSPRTFTSTLEVAPSGSDTHIIDLDPSKLAKDGAQAKPGFIAVEDCTLPTALLSAAWHDFGAYVAVKAGSWLARGQHAELSSPKMSLCQFLADDQLRDYEMRCSYAPPGYVIHMHSDLLAECSQNEGSPAAKATILAGFVAALADANTQSAFGGGQDADESDKELIGYQLEQTIKAIDPECPAPGEEGYDPLRAATILLQEEMSVFVSLEEE